MDGPWHLRGDPVTLPGTAREGSDLDELPLRRG